MKKGFIFLFVLLLLLTAAAVQADDLADVMQNGVLRMGSSPEYIPFVFYDDNGNMDGIDIALIQEAARRMGVRVEDRPRGLTCGHREGPDQGPAAPSGPCSRVSARPALSFSPGSGILAPIAPMMTREPQVSPEV